MSVPQGAVHGRADSSPAPIPPAVAPPDPGIAARLGIVISMFPELHETFILRELVALERAGIDFDIYSLQYPRDPITIPEAQRLSASRTTYGRLFGAPALIAFARQLFRHPLTTLRTIATVIIEGRDRPREAIKNLAILPLTLHFAELGRQRGTTHWHGHWANVPTTACWYLQQLFGDSWSAAIHGEDIFTHNRFLARKLDDAAFAVVCSGYFCRHLQCDIGLRHPGHVHLNYHGLDPRVTERAAAGSADSTTSPAHTGPGPHTLRIVSIGRLVPTKGHDTLLTACARLRDVHGMDFSLELIGSGPIDAELRALAGTLGIDEAVHFRGGLAFEDVLQTLEAADVFCLAPRLLPGHPPDGIPNVIAEAMALGVPVIATCVSAIPELVEHDVSGLLVDVDDADGMADAIARLASEPATAERLSEGARVQVARLFDQRRNIAELLETFERYVPGRVVGSST